MAALANKDSQNLFKVAVIDSGDANTFVKLSMQLGGEEFSFSTMKTAEATKLMAGHVRPDQIEDESSLEEDIHGAKNVIFDVNLLNGFKAADQPVAAALISQIRDLKRPLNEKILAFIKLSGLPNTQGAFKIKIEDDPQSPARIRFMVGDEVLFGDACRTGEDYAACWLACPANLINDEQPKGNYPMLMHRIAKLSKENFDTIFREANRPAALNLLNAISGNPQNMNNQKFIELFDLADNPLELSAALFPPRTVKQRKHFDMAFHLLRGKLLNVPSKIGVRGAVSEAAKNDLIKNLDIVFGPGSQFPADSQFFIKQRLYKCIDQDIILRTNAIKREVIDRYFGVKAT